MHKYSISKQSLETPSDLYHGLGYELHKTKALYKTSVSDQKNIIQRAVLTTLKNEQLQLENKVDIGKCITHITNNPGKGYRYKLSKSIGNTYLTENSPRSLPASIQTISIISELLHILSLIVDDYIDGDTTRHGDLALHIKYTPSAILRMTSLISSTVYRLIDELDADVAQKFAITQALHDTCQELAVYFNTETKWQYQNSSTIRIVDINQLSILRNYVCKGGGISLFSIKALAILNPNHSEEISQYSQVTKKLAIMLQRANDLENLALHTFDGDENTDRFTDFKEKRCTYLVSMLSKSNNSKTANYLDQIYVGNNPDAPYELFEHINELGVLTDEIKRIKKHGQAIIGHQHIAPNLRNSIAHIVSGYIDQIKLD